MKKRKREYWCSAILATAVFGGALIYLVSQMSAAYPWMEDPRLTEIVNNCASEIKAKTSPAMIKLILGGKTPEAYCREAAQPTFEMNKALAEDREWHRKNELPPSGRSQAQSTPSEPQKTSVEEPKKEDTFSAPRGSSASLCPKPHHMTEDGCQ